MIKKHFVRISSLLTILFCTLIAANICFGQSNLLSLQAIFGTGPAGQTISSNSSGNPVPVPLGGQISPLSVGETVAGAGTIQGDAAALSATKWVHRITGANGTVGWILPATTITTSTVCHINLNTTAGVALIYPATGGTINAAAANGVFTALTGIKPIVCCATATDTWLCA